MPLASGEQLGHYKILSLIGKGGMGEVYKAFDTTLKRDVAIKVLPAAFAGDPNRMARFQREAEVLASLNHPNIAQVFGLVEHEGTRAIAMEFVEGDSPSGPIPLRGQRFVLKPLFKHLDHDLPVIQAAGDQRTRCRQSPIFLRSRVINPDSGATN